jgi:hypothetical protein
MNNGELEEILKSVSPPDREPEYWAQLTRRITAATRRRERGAERRVFALPRRWLIFAWGGAVAVSCWLIRLALLDPHPSQATGELLQNGKIVREVLAAFPNQVQAIVHDENGLHLAIAEHPDIPSSTPIWIKVCAGNRCWSLVTFSGQTVEIADQRVEVLVEAGGSVILAGARFVWPGEDVVGTAGLRISARPLAGFL